MSYSLYLTITLFLYALILLCAIVFDSIGLIFEFMAAICSSSLIFIFPGLFYILSQNKFCSQHERDSSKCRRFEAYVMVVAGFLVFALCLTTNILELAGGKEKKEEIEIEI